MGSGIKAMTVLAVMMMTFAILPTFGASAAEPLPDDTYGVMVGGETHSFTVIDGQPQPDVRAGVEFDFRFKDGKVLDAFDVRVDGVLWEVKIKDGEVKVDLVVDEEADDEGDDEPAENLTLEEVEDPAVEVKEEDTGEVEEATHGDIVSTVAACAPRGKVAKDLGLPTHGVFVSAAAKGDVHTFTVGDNTYDADFRELATATLFCEETLVTMVADAEAALAAETVEEPVDESRGNGNGQEKQAEKDTGRPDDAGKPDHAGPKDKDKGGD